MGCHFLLQGDLPHPGVEPASLAPSAWILYHCTPWEAPGILSYDPGRHIILVGVRQSLSYRFPLGSREMEDSSSACERAQAERGASQWGRRCLYRFSKVNESYCLRSRAENSRVGMQLLGTVTTGEVTIVHHQACVMEKVSGGCCWELSEEGIRRASQTLSTLQIK